MGWCKKKLDIELAVFFPAEFGTDLEHLDRIREYEMLIIRESLGEDVDVKMKELVEYFVMRQKPNVFNPFEPGNVLIASDNSFEEICVSLEENGVSNPKALTVYEFYSKLTIMKKKADKLNQKL